MRETVREIAIAVGGAALVIGALVGPVWLITRVPGLASRSVRLAAYGALALIVSGTLALDVRSILFWSEARQALSGKPPEAIKAKPTADKIVRDAIHQDHVTRLVVWEDAWSGSGLAIRYDLATGRLVSVDESISDGGLASVVWWLHFVSLVAGLTALSEWVSWLRRRGRKSEAA